MWFFSILVILLNVYFSVQNYLMYRKFCRDGKEIDLILSNLENLLFRVKKKCNEDENHDQ